MDFPIGLTQCRLSKIQNTARFNQAALTPVSLVGEFLELAGKMSQFGVEDPDQAFLLGG